MTEHLICRFVVPGPPVPKARPRVARGHAYTPARTREAEARIIQHLWAAYPRLRPVSGPVKVEAWFYLATRRRVDGDNLFKLLDALNGIVYVDDSQIKDGHFMLRHDPANPRTEVAVYALDDLEQAA